MKLKCRGEGRRGYMSVVNMSEHKKNNEEIKTRILENQEIILYTLYKLVQRQFDQSKGDGMLIRSLVACFHETRKINGKSYIAHGCPDLLSKGYYDEIKKE